MNPATIALAAAMAMAAILAALVWGVQAGRHGGFPSGAVVAAGRAVLRHVDPERYWRRDIHATPREGSAMECPTNPIVIVTGGQSNAANHLSDPVDERPDLPAAMFYDGRCYRLADPLPGASGHRGSLWAALGQRLAAQTGRGVVMINGAMAATTYSDWLTPQSGYLDRLEQAVVQARSQGLEPHFLLWHQGESDAHSRAPAAQHAARLDALAGELLERIIPSPQARLVLYRVSICNGARSGGNGELVAAQNQVAARRERVIAGPDTDLLGPRYRHDDCHFNARGRDAVVEATLDVLLPLID